MFYVYELNENLELFLSKTLIYRDLYFLMFYVYELNENLAPSAPCFVQKKIPESVFGT
jgi:hypothetical protein